MKHKKRIAARKLREEYAEANTIVVTNQAPEWQPTPQQIPRSKTPPGEAMLALLGMALPHITAMSQMPFSDPEDHHPS